MAKKKKHADFQKVKLKVGRKIQRATNETKTQFKVKSINIRSQFADSRQSSSEINGTSSKKINVKVTN